MRRQMGSGTKFAARWMAVLLAVGVIAGTAMPAAAQRKSSPVAGQASSAEASSVTKALFLALGKGAASQVSGFAAGWALDAMGLSAKSSDELAALRSINGNLETIINQLNGIQQQLQQLNATLQQLNCDWLSSNLTEWLAKIDSLAATYQAFNDVAAGKYGAPAVPPLESMTTWADQVTNDVTGVGPALHAISNALLPSGPAQGIIRACLQPGVIPPPAPGTFGDTGYYDHVANLIDYYYAYQVRGLLLLAEAYHFQAEQASGQAPPANDPGKICTEAADPRAKLACTLAYNYTNLVYERLAHQFALAGLPYTDDEVIVENTGGPNPPLYVRSLEKFTQTAGQSCPTPLTADTPCGVTTALAGDTAHIAAPMHVDYDGYSTWYPANSYHLGELIKNRGSMTPGQYLDAHGFENAGDKILLTPQTTTIRYKISYTRKNLHVDVTVHARCFLDTDTSFGVACSDGVFKSHILGNGPLYECYNDRRKPSWPTWVDRASLPSDRNGFYTAWLRPNRNTGRACTYHFDPKPGWALGGTAGGNTRQYRWPKLQVASDLTCTDGRSPTNPGGVPTRCGANFDTIFNELVPRPENCEGTTFGQCRGTVSDAMTGPQAGVRSA